MLTLGAYICSFFYMLAKRPIIMNVFDSIQLLPNLLRLPTREVRTSIRRTPAALLVYCCAVKLAT